MTQHTIEIELHLAKLVVHYDYHPAQAGGDYDEIIDACVESDEIFIGGSECGNLLSEAGLTDEIEATVLQLHEQEMAEAA